MCARAGLAGLSGCLFFLAGGCFVGWPGEGLFFYLFIFSETVTQPERTGNNHGGLTFPWQAHASGGGYPQPAEALSAY